MALNASIFIADISGYTEFLSSTELEHSSHIINELLKVLVESNTTDLTLAEIEGDALLFYRTGEPLSFDEMTHQVIVMFSNFHTRLKIIERDSICQCGACQTASNLSDRFEPVTEIRHALWRYPGNSDFQLRQGIRHRYDHCPPTDEE